MIRLKILEIIQYIMDLRLDFRISNLLVNLKKFCASAEETTGKERDYLCWDTISYHLFILMFISKPK